jgi:transposase
LPGPRGYLAKTDRVDALVLADFARCLRPEVRPLKDEETRTLEELPDRRRQLVEACVQERLRLDMAVASLVDSNQLME